MMKKFFSLLMMALLALAAGAETAEFDLTTGFTNQQDVSTVTKDGVTLTFDKGANSNTPKWYTSGSAVRLYGGGTLTITAVGISKVEFTFNGDSNLSSDLGTYSVGTWTGEANSIVFTQGGTSGHVKIQKVVVTYAGDPNALYAPNVLLNGEAPKPQYTTDELPLVLSFVSNNGTEYPTGQYSLMEDPDNEGFSTVAYDFELILGDDVVHDLRYGSNKLSVREVLNWLGEDETVSPWGSITFVVKEPIPVISSIAEFNGLADKTELTFGENLTVVGQKDAYLYAQDAEKGVLIYGEGQPAYQLGDIIPAGFTGTKTTYKGAPEMINPAGLQAATQNVPPMPLELTPSEVNLDNFGRYAAIRGATIDGTTITASGETATLFNRFEVDVPSTGTVFDIYGVVGYYNGAQFMPLQYVDVSPQPPLTVAISPVPAEGQVFTEPVQVTIACNRANAQVSYEIDNYMQEYTGPFIIYESTTVRAIANADNGAIAEDTQTYTIELPDMAVTFTPPAGTYTSAQNVKLNIANTFGELTVLYTLNNGEQWNEYTADGIDVTESATLKVVVTDGRNTPQEFTAEYVVNLPVVKTVTGVVTDSENNTPLEGASVTITVKMPEEPVGMRRAEGDAVTYTATTDAEGVYTMDVTEVEGATYGMTVEKEGYDTQTIDNIDLDNPQNVSLVKTIITAISDLSAAKGNVKYIDVNGRVSNRPFSGVNIVVGSDGTITKVVK
ncbi:MAG: carboxypeptidase regulatory-like domain-containing protein [Muribaculaceae bacterium]|nr:carboxypeptidase regulatory-like domain-containing protein [Muribaculaceae bacterium]